MHRFARHLGAQGRYQAAGAKHVRIGMVAGGAVQLQADLAGQVEPNRDLFFGTGCGVGFGQTLQNLPADQMTEQVGFGGPGGPDLGPRMGCGLHNHPVNPKEVDLKDQRYQWRRCYKLVSLIHINRELNLFLTVAARVVGGRSHECPILYELVDEFVKAVHHGWMKILILDRGFIDGPQIGRLKTDYGIDTVIPLKTNMDAYHDVMGLTRLKDFGWEPYQPPVARLRGQKDPVGSGLRRPKPPVIVKREQKRQQTLAARKGLPPPPPLPWAQTFLGIARGVASWSDCPVPLTAVVNREIDSSGKTDHWVLVTTAADFTAPRIRSTYALRTAIEERHRQYKCYWDIPRMHSRQFSLVVNQVLFVLLAYTLMQGHLFLRHRQELNRRTRSRTLDMLGPTVEVVAVYYQQRFCLLLLPEFGAILLEVTEPARAKLLKKMRQLKHDLYHLLKNPRSP